MYYDTIEIKPVGGKWRAGHEQIDGDRQSEKRARPNALGFFHYPRSWGLQKGFSLLQDEMIKRHEEEIAALSKSLDALRQLQPPGHACQCT